MLQLGTYLKKNHPNTENKEMWSKLKKKISATSREST